MKHRLLACPLLAIVILAGTAQPGAAQVVGNPGDPILVVYPTGAHPADVNNVQYAVDNVASPGTVVMMSTDMSLNPLAFDFGGTAVGNGGVLKLLRPDVTLAGDGWDDALAEPKTKIVGGGGAYRFSSSVSGAAMVFAVKAPGVVIREIKLATAFAYTGVFIVSTTAWPASDHPVVVERNDVSVLNYAVLAQYTAAFPVKIDGNVLKGGSLVDARWIGFTLRPITTPVTYDEPAVPVDALGNAVRYPFEITNNTMIKTPGATLTTLAVYGWANYYNTAAGADLTDPDIGCRRYGSSPNYRYQCVAGDNGPVFITGNRISVDTPLDAIVSAIELGVYDSGVNDAVVAGNAVSGTTYAGLRTYGYMRGAAILDNDFSGLQAAHQIVFQATDSVVAGNILGPILPFGGWVYDLPQPALLLTSANFYPGYSPMPRPAENCVFMQNDYRLTGVERGAILLASRAELRYPTGAGTEVKNNLIFETGRFPRGTGGPLQQVIELNIMTNPATGLPYVHDNRIVGQSANGLDDPGIGPEIRKINAIRRMLMERGR